MVPPNSPKTLSNGQQENEERMESIAFVDQVLSSVVALMQALGMAVRWKEVSGDAST